MTLLWYLGEVVLRDGAAFAVFEPFLADLVAVAGMGFVNREPSRITPESLSEKSV